MREFKDLTRLTKVTVATLAVYMAADLLNAALAIYVSRSIEAMTDPQIAGLHALFAIAMLVGLFASYLLVGCWIYRASANAHSFSDEMTISPGWAVGWYFVPIANLFKPYQGMREIWMASHFRGNWHGEPTPQLLIGWWALWIIVNVLGNISFQLSIRQSDGDLLGTTTLIDAAAAVLNVPLCLILIAMMRRIAHAQATAPYDETFA